MVIDKDREKAWWAKLIFGLGLFVIAIIVGFSGCATSGSLVIQKKCSPVDNFEDTFVCEEP